MGTYGTGLYSDDLASDVRDDYKEQLKSGKTDEEALQFVLDRYSDHADDPDDGPVFWFALSDTLWNLGRITAEVRDKALDLLQLGEDLPRWEEEGPQYVAARAQTLRKLEEKLLLEPPPRKKVSVTRIYRCKWKVGDVFAYKLSVDDDSEDFCTQKYICFVKMYEHKSYPGHVSPVVYVFKRLFSSVPDISEIENIPLLPIFFTKEYIRRCPERLSFSLELLTTSSRVIPKDRLTYIGNTDRVPLIKVEEYPRSLMWKFFDKYVKKDYVEWKDS